jgi:hypothetical protein
VGGRSASPCCKCFDGNYTAVENKGRQGREKGMNRSGNTRIAKGMYFISLSTKCVQEEDAVTDAIKVKDIDSKNHSGRPLNEALRGEEF